MRGLPLNTVALFMVLTALVWIDATHAVDALGLYLIQAVASPPLDVVASLVTIAGQAELTILAALGLTLWWTRREGRSGLVPLLIFAGLVFELVLKRVVPQPPPADDLVRTIHFLPGLSGGASSSFPSGHTWRVFFLAGLLAPRYPRWGLGLFGLAVAVALTRVYLGVHWPSDVVGGAVLGLIFAGLASSLRERWSSG